MLLRNFGYVTLPGTPLDPDSVLEEIRVFSRHAHSVYRRFLRYMRDELGYRDEEDLFLFAYDWRLDCRYSAFKLQAYIREKQAKLRDRNAKFIIIAHSMGGLVARYCVQMLGMVDCVRTIVTAGTPHHGSANALKTLLRGANIFPFAWRRRSTIPAVRSFPSTYQLLPFKKGYLIDENGKQLLITDTALWDWLGTTGQAHMNQAHEFHLELAAAANDVPIHSICGYGQNTLARVGIRQHAKTYDWQHPRWSKQPDGDGEALCNSAIYDDELKLEVNQRHDRLLDDPEARQYIRDMLTNREPVMQSRNVNNAPRLDVRFVATEYEIGDTAILFVGLLDARGKIVRGARFRVDLHGPVRNYQPVTVRPLFVLEEKGTQRPGQVVMASFPVPDEPGEYYVRVTLIQSGGLVLTPTHRDQDFKVYPSK